MNKKDLFVIYLLHLFVSILSKYSLQRSEVISSPHILTLVLAPTNTHTHTHTQTHTQKHTHTRARTHVHSFAILIYQPP